MKGWQAVVLAAGKGTRMRSRIPKVLHPVGGKPMLDRVLDTLAELGIRNPILVLGHDAPHVRRRLRGRRVTCVLQEPQLGTGHALLQARYAVRPSVHRLLVLCADAPLLRPETLACLAKRHEETEAYVTVLTSPNAAADGMGRVLRDAGGRVTGIVEDRETNATERAIAETNTGIYAVATGGLWPLLESLPRHSNGEVYLTDLIRLCASAGRPVEALTLADPLEGMGVNDRESLARAEAELRRRVCQRWMREGVTIMDPATAYIDETVRIGRDTVVYPGTWLRGKTTIGAGCHIGPQTIATDSRIGPRCKVLASVLEECTLEADVDMGPFCHLRQGAYLERRVHLGNYVEVKKSRLGAGTQSGHFSYIGDAEIGRNVNVGAGTITCNYDGVTKHRTVIGEGALIGSDTMLVAPVTVGARAKTGAGAVVTQDVPPGETWVGVPARPLAKRAFSNLSLPPVAGSLSVLRRGTDEVPGRGESRAQAQKHIAKRSLPKARKRGRRR